MYSNFRRIIRMLCILIGMSIVVNVGLFIYVYNLATRTVETRLNDLTQMVATSNLLSQEDGAYNSFKQLLAASENQFVKFSNNVSSDPSYGNFTPWGNPNLIDPSFFSVTAVNNSGARVSLYTYDNVVQRNTPITCTLKARVYCPFLFTSKVDLGNLLPIYVEKSYTVIGQKFYKGIA